MSIRNFADGIAAIVIGLGAPLFRAVGRNPGGFPRYLRQADKSGVHLRATHYYHPTYSDADLPADVTFERHLPGLDLREADQLGLLEAFNYQAELQKFMADSTSDLTFSHDNRAYAYADAESLYCMLRMRKPKRLIEIGSGHSTRIAKAALDENRLEVPGYTCDHICIEPYEMDWLDRLGVEVMRKRAQDVEVSWFEQLQAGDVLFIDSSHVIRPFGDVLFEYLELVPTLAKGVLVHVHDIFTPRDYPERWLRQERRLWNEQYLMEAMLAHSPRYRVVLALNWLWYNHAERLHRAFPAFAAKPESQPGAFWFEIAE